MKFVGRFLMGGQNKVLHWWGKSQKAICLFLLLVVWGFAMGEGILGLNFGKHWDEINHLEAVKYSLENKILLPNFYDYPSIPYWLNLIGVIPDVLQAWSAGLRDGADVQKFLQVALFSSQHLLFVRGIFLLLSSLGIFWVFLAAYESGTGWGASTVAAMAYGLSWEVAYHSRWIAPDALLAQFAALFLWILIRAQKTGEAKWIRIAAIVAGLATGTKYPGGIIFVPVVILAFVWGRTEGGLRRGVRRIMEVAAIFLLTYLITTPGTVLQPLSFLSDVTRDIRHYATGHMNYSTSPGPIAMGQVLIYFMTAAFSYGIPFALLFFTLAVLGVIAAFLFDAKRMALIWIFPLLYFLYFTSQRVMIIRNYLLLLPFLSIGVAWGVPWLMRKLRSAPWRVAVSGLISIALIWNAYWMANAAQSILERGGAQYAREAAEYLDSHTDQKIWVSQMVANDISGLGLASTMRSVLSAPDNADYWMFYTNEDPNRKAWPANNPFLTTVIFGPMEVNFNYYPSWPGDDRIVVMKRDTAGQIGVPRIP